ncbi:NADH:ubiquinone reductase (Na(+)-transporting) subunit B [Saprospiraceae bacterium]|nr:NADH:ubiquinone reductase (Na(+)-transporting) subunit B [Saprospiraceae bacterium]HCV50990.1 NADH:ubiquinone reductase (Na(+)-transporting) subunit B [Saprospirales bacterium]MDA9264197.1 NADH:ubiquinone reductase (Na(+)-transporting) subunit B [Saprospiraceae bacterium]MDA9357986.1 NADH:ubiquinone reductase (Na(+)-transporting) subunit B [Saprospiraceae bacterium]MDB4162578.1 NADH:ubiquinone reductase (Na(+)-transporting) subunit B [Saprospiraceae bacterium]
MGLVDFFKKIEPDKKKSPVLHTFYDAVYTFALAPDSITGPKGTQIKDGMDLKRLMVHVVIAMQLCYLFGTYNIGHQHFTAAGQYLGFIEGFHLKLAHGLILMLPIFIVTHVVGLGIEIIFAAKKGHAVEEGFLVSGALIPLIMPPDIPLWILAVAVAFAVILGKEAFGGTGMNIWNIALLARVFVFFAYPTTIAGDEVWVSGFDGLAEGTAATYGWAHNLFNTLFGWLGLDGYNAASTAVVDGYTGATPLALAYQGGWEGATAVYTPSQMWWGTIPGSIGESSKPLILIGALFLLVTKIASWRIMLSMLIGGIVGALTLNAWGATPFMEVPWYYQFFMGSFFFAMAFMATDPVTAASTNTGKWWYGFLIGFIGMIIRVLNPAYPEGWMLAILFMNTFAPLIDHYVLQSNISKRLKRA